MYRDVTKFQKYIWKYLTFKRKLAAILEVEIVKVEKLYREMYKTDFFTHMRKTIYRKGNIFDLSMLNPMRAPVLYVLCRVVKPQIVLETGVANGFSTGFILKALEDNGGGKLYSIDFPNQPGHEIEQGKDVGWVIPQKLREKWELIIGNSKGKLPDLVKELGEIDVFYHDSDHSYGHVLFELNTVWDSIKRRGCIVADDTNTNNAFVDFCNRKEQEYKKFYWLGVARKI